MRVRSSAVTTGQIGRRRAVRRPRATSAATIGPEPTSLSVWLTGRSMRILEGAVALTAMVTALLLGAGR